MNVLDINLGAHMLYFTRSLFLQFSFLWHAANVFSGLFLVSLATYMIATEERPHSYFQVYLLIMMALFGAILIELSILTFLKIKNAFMSFLFGIPCGLIGFMWFVKYFHIKNFYIVTETWILASVTATLALSVLLPRGYFIKE